MGAADRQRSTPSRFVFGAAAIYNIAFGAWAILRPMDFFNWFELELPTHAYLWSCLGMVIGVYGLGYAYIAWKPHRGDVIAALGLLGKVLGPVGWWLAVRRGDIPPRTFPMILFNDLLWWYPFGWHLLRNVRNHRAALVAAIILFHVVGSVLLVMVRPGTEAQPIPELRRAFIAEHMPAWVLCWSAWVCASLGLYVFFILWAGELRRVGAAKAHLIVICGLCAVGLSCDVLSECIAIVALTDVRRDLQFFTDAARTATLLGAGAGNGIYCLSGLAMSALSWRLGFQRGWIGVLAFAVWASGLILSAAAFADRGDLMLIFGGGLMMLFVPWAAMTGVRFSKRRHGCA